MLLQNIEEGQEKFILVHDRAAREEMLYIIVEFQKSQQQQQKTTRNG